jgi:hypothetical protein
MRRLHGSSTAAGRSTVLHVDQGETRWRVGDGVEQVTVAEPGVAAQFLVVVGVGDDLPVADRDPFAVVGLEVFGMCARARDRRYLRIL